MFPLLYRFGYTYKFRDQMKFNLQKNIPFFFEV